MSDTAPESKSLVQKRGGGGGRTNKCSTHSFQVLYELAFTHGKHSHMGIWKRTLIFSQPPLGSSSVSDIHSSVVDTGDCLDLVSFVQQASENESVPLVSVCPSVTYFIVSKLPSS